MAYEILYKDGKRKALTFSYDDGQIFDRRLVKIFNDNGLKATFHLNSGNLSKEGRVTAQELPGLYAGHEVAVHGVHHLWLNQLSKQQLVNEIINDRRELEGIMKMPITGMSYAYGAYGREIIDALKVLGIEYSRTVSSTNSFNMPTEFLEWNPTCHHNADLMNLGANFLENKRNLPLFYIWGHSFEFDRENTWEKMEEFCKFISNKEDVWYATNMEIKRYITAVRSLVFSVDETYVFNNSAETVFMNINGELVQLKPAMTAAL